MNIQQIERALKIQEKSRLLIIRNNALHRQCDLLRRLCREFQKELAEFDKMIDGGEPKVRDIENGR